MKRALLWTMLVAALAVPSLSADSSAEVFDLVASMAAGLSEDNGAGFAAALSESMPGRDALIASVRASIVQADLGSAVERIQEDGDDSKRTLVLDWSLELKRKGPDLQIERRREAITLTFEREGKKWKVTSLSPASFFAPPNFR
jgi:hypothetical protein